MSDLQVPPFSEDMKMPIEEQVKSQILEMEEELRHAMLHSDVTALNKLLSPHLIFTNHIGQIFSKIDDLSAHCSGEFEITHLEVSEHHMVLLNENVVIVSAKAHMVGSYADIVSDNIFRFTRVWTLTPWGQWQVISGHSSALPKTA